MKAILLVFSLLLSYRFCIVSRPDEILKKKSGEMRKWRNSGKQLAFWSLRSMGLLLALIFTFPSFHSFSPPQAIKPSNSVSGLLETAQPRRCFAVGHKSAPSLCFYKAPTFGAKKTGCAAVAPTSKDGFVCDASSVHIAMTLDAAYLRGSMAAVFSILQHASCPENIVFHFLTTEGHTAYSTLMKAIFPSLKFKLYNFQVELVKDRISTSVRQALEQPLNYARNYLADLLEPCIERIIYLDSDLVVVDDISKLWATNLGPHIIGAPEYCHANFTKYFTPLFWEDADLSSTFNGKIPCYFNTGVMIMDLEKWRMHNCSRKIEYWMDVQKERRIYELGSLPPFLLVFAGLVEPVEHKWNQHGLGGDNIRGSCRLLHRGPVSLLHWSGEGKPWTRLDSRQPCLVDSLWAPFDLHVNTFY